MRVGIDARFLTHPQVGGFKTYTENLVAALAELGPEHDYVLYLDRPPGERSLLPRQPNVTTRIVRGTMPIVGMPWREQVALTRQAARDGLDLFHAPCLSAPLRLGCPLAVTIHDVIWRLRRPVQAGGARPVQRTLMDWYYRLVPRFAARRAGVVITVSDASKRGLMKHLGLDAGRVFVTHEAAGDAFREVTDAARVQEACRRHGLGDAFVLAIGSDDPRKNLSTLVQAYARVPEPLRKTHRLVVVWTHPLLAENVTRQVAALGLRDDVQFVQRVPTSDLVALYNAAAVFVFPSRYEGFGLPPLEAMACGTAVIAADNSSIPEIVGDAALLVDADDVNGIADSMVRVLTDEKLRLELEGRGRARARGFSWRQCARETLTAYAYATQGQ